MLTDRTFLIGAVVGAAVWYFFLGAYVSSLLGGIGGAGDSGTLGVGGRQPKVNRKKVY